MCSEVVYIQKYLGRGIVAEGLLRLLDGAAQRRYKMMRKVWRLYLSTIVVTMKCILTELHSQISIGC